MARRRRRSTRRRNPVRSTGALILNPRRRRRRKTTTRRRNTTAARRKRGMSKAARSRAAKKGWRKRRRNGTRRNARRTTARKKTTRRRRTSTRRRRNTARRRNPIRVRRNRRPNRRPNRRRNPGALAGIKRSLRKIPLIGRPAADMVGFAPYAAFGAAGVEPTMMLAKWLTPYYPRLNSSVFYAGSGLLVAALVSRFAPVSPAIRQKLAIAIASAAGGVAYYKWRTGTDAPMAGEYGLLEYGDSAYGDGGAWAVAPF